MTRQLKLGTLTARFAVNEADVLACQRLRHSAFFGGEGVDSDRFDPSFEHIVIENEAGTLLSTMRLRVLDQAEKITDTYTGQFYKIVGLTGPLIEMGRFCVAYQGVGPDVLRIAWAFVTAQVDQHRAKWLFGCSSFSGTNPKDHAQALALLGRRYQVESGIRITPQHVDFVAVSGNLSGPITCLPALLRSYLSMGGKTGPHAVIDHEMGTLHVCTLLETARVPHARAARLRALAANSGLHQNTSGNS